MNFTSLFLFFGAALGVLSLAASASPTTDTFGSGPNQFNLEFVEIGSPGNTADTTGDPNPAGAVSYFYRMSKFEVSEDIINKANAAGNLGITKDAVGANKPATSVSWNEAARFVNWLNTSQGFSPAYKFATQPGSGGYNANANIQLWTNSDPGYNAANPFRNLQAYYFLPNVDEWYKAAYFNPNTNTYSDYPYGLNTVPTPTAGSTAANTAVYNGQAGPADVFNAGGLSPFGIMGLGGNVWEWTETETDLLNDSSTADRMFRGGDYVNDSLFFSSLVWNNVFPANENPLIGFRVASLSPIPEPSTYALAFAGMMVVAWSRWRRRGK